MSLSVETASRVCERLVAIEAEISRLETTAPHDTLPPEYDDLIARRDSARELLAEARKGEA